MTGFLVVVGWVALVLFVVGLFAAARRNDRAVENARRARVGLPPLREDEDA